MANDFGVFVGVIIMEAPASFASGAFKQLKYQPIVAFDPGRQYLHHLRGDTHQK